MSGQRNSEFITRYLEAISGKAKSPELVARFVTDEALIEHIAAFEAAFPRYELIAEELIAEGDKVAMRSTFRGVHRGEFNGIAPSGRAASCAVMLIYQVVDERIVSHYMLADSLTLLQQLGALPIPATATAS